MHTLQLPQSQKPQRISIKLCGIFNCPVPKQFPTLHRQHVGAAPSPPPGAIHKWSLSHRALSANWPGQIQFPCWICYAAMLPLKSARFHNFTISPFIIYHVEHLRRCISSAWQLGRQLVSPPGLSASRSLATGKVY